MAFTNRDGSSGQNPQSLPNREPFGQAFGLYHSHHDIFIYVEPPRVRHRDDQTERSIYGQRVRNSIPRIFLSLTRFYNLLLEEFYKYQARDQALRRALHILIHETALLLSRTSFAISQFAVTPTSWVSTVRLNDHLVSVAQDHASLATAFASLRSSGQYRMALWRNNRLFF